MSRKLAWAFTSVASALAIATCCGSVAHAQAAAGSQNEKASAATIAEVVVTAERRTANLQTTAIAASVLTGADLAEKGIVTVDQLQTAMPSVTVQNFGQGNNFNIRGIGKGATNSATLVGVVTYRDGVATFPGYFQTEPYYDIASLEVLRGPQGTFAGQNATGGAVFITEVNPTFNGVHGYVQGQYGNYDDAAVQGAVNLPISDTLAARIAFNDEYRDSFYKVTGPYSGHPGRLEEESLRGSLLWQPTDALKVLFKTDYNYIDQGGYPADPFNAKNDPFHITSNAPSLAIDQFVRSVLDVNYKLDDGITVRSVTGYQKGRSASKLDLDGTSALGFTLRDGVDEELWSEELNIISPDQGPLTWVAGLYYSHDVFTFPKEGGFDIGEPPGGLDITLSGTNPKETKAVFGQVSYALASGLELQVGARYSDFTGSNHIVAAIPEFGAAFPQNQSEHDSKLTGKIALNWTIDADNFVYAFVATGHKGGGLNTPSSLVLPPVFKPEDVTDYELGWKNTALDGHLKTQVGAYYNDYRNFQVSIGDPTNPVQSLELNITSPSKIYGVEGQAQAVFGALSFDLGVSLLHSELGTFYAVDPRAPGAGICNPSSGPATAVCLNITGNQQVYAPTFTFNVGAEYEFQLDGGATLTPRLNFGHIAPQWATLFENPTLGDRLGERNLLSGQLAYQRGDWRLAAYGTNLTDQRYVTAVNAGLRYEGAPRQYGMRLSKTF
jgi:iron complex outermembrane recepter protein